MRLADQGPAASGALRLDMALVSRGFASTRARARDAILRGHVRVDGARAGKPSMMVAPEAAIAIDDPAATYVSRSALKLIAGLDHFGYDAAGRAALDIGASTGGFTQVLIERGAKSVLAIDVGHGQLAAWLAADPRVIKREGLNVRDLALTDVERPLGAIVADVSFISLRLALPAALAFAGAGTWGVFLVKPQFEVGPAGVGKRGIVRDRNRARQAAEDIAGWLAGQPGWRVDGLIDSPIAGGDGNREFLLGGRHD